VRGQILAGGDRILELSGTECALSAAFPRLDLLIVEPAAAEDEICSLVKMIPLARHVANHDGERTASRRTR